VVEEALHRRESKPAGFADCLVAAYRGHRGCRMTFDMKARLLDFVAA